MTVKPIILVTGATGNQGSAVTKGVLEQGKFTIRALVRNKASEKAKALETMGVELVAGDYDDVASLEKALQGVWGVFSMQDFTHGVDVEVKQGKTVADLAKKAGVNHFVYSSVGSANRHTGIPHFDSKYQIEAYIRAIGLPYTILRPVYFMYNYRNMQAMIDNGLIALPLSPDTKLQQLSETDYGNMVATVFADSARFLGKELDVASVSISMNELAATFSKVLNKPVRYQQISLDRFREQTGDEMSLMFSWFESVGYSANLAESETMFFPLSSVDGYLAQNWGTT
ncbi:NmrA/HSCARG family protein [Spirosoma sp. KNUC1025]|uniref:NmrA/HSCARG family protein n=1 Tax=Spirosoma sp. KNUC1025 TaxID=2894082 RepID=UPI001E3D060D|nr:NmrA/HSCARG family protein [Spirosoma sp. KNUC1025]UFH57761.1 NmrA/HSCARG family protein [Spirosoma sp. KNUC1025]